jgi:hypothetical protein
MRLLFVCAVVPHPRRPGYRIPVIELVRNGPAGSFPATWIIGGERAVGVCEASAAQVVALNAEPGLLAVPESEADQRLATIGAGLRAVIDDYMIALDVPVRADDTVRTLFERAAQPVGGGRTDDWQHQLARSFGL